MGVPKTSDHIQINIRMPNSNQEPPVSSKAQNEDLEDMDVLCTFKIKIEIMGVSKTSEHIQIKMYMPNPNLRQTKYLKNAEIFRASLRRIKYLLKA